MLAVNANGSVSKSDFSSIILLVQVILNSFLMVFIPKIIIIIIIFLYVIYAFVGTGICGNANELYLMDMAD